MSVPQAKVIVFEQARRMRRVARPRRRFRFRLGRWLAIAGIVYGLVMFGTQEVKLFRMRSQVGALKQQIQQTQADNERLQQEIQQLNGDAYIEKAAREELGMIKSNEVTYIPAEPR
ncbi:MAG: FtsB family cell division protein [Chloroflexota bacterium]